MITVITGEEEDYTIHQVRSKLFSLENGQWKERGTGLMKLNIRHSDGTGARLGVSLALFLKYTSDRIYSLQSCGKTLFTLCF